MPTLHVIVASTRPGRIGRPVGEWFAAQAREHGAFDVELVDLAEVGLPLFDEPKHPRLQDYAHEHTRRWSETVSRADAFAFVMPEYNHGYNAALKNAIDFLWLEWNDKPVALVGYGGVSGGTRAMQSLKPVLGAVKLRLVAEVPIPFVHERTDDDGAIEANEPMVQGAGGALDALDAEVRLLAAARQSVG
jgi:NAD(P)H-dependent FMN reductase